MSQRKKALSSTGGVPYFKPFIGLFILFGMTIFCYNIDMNSTNLDADLKTISQLSIDQLKSLESCKLRMLTRRVVGTAAVSKLVTGRCIAALDETNAADEEGFSGGMHFVSVMGLEASEGRTVRRVARALDELPLLRAAAETASIPWSSLKMIVSKATAETEETWLELARNSVYRIVEDAVSHTRKGELPNLTARQAGESEATDSVQDLPNEELGCELRFFVSPEFLAYFREVVMAMSEEAGRRLSMGELFEHLVVFWRLNEGRLPAERDLELARGEGRKNLEADRERKQNDLQMAISEAVEKPRRSARNKSKSRVVVELSSVSSGDEEDHNLPLAPTAEFAFVAPDLVEAQHLPDGSSCVSDEGPTYDQHRLKNQSATLYAPPDGRYVFSDGASIISSKALEFNDGCGYYSDDTPCYDASNELDPERIGWIAAAARTTLCPGNHGIELVRPERASWRNGRLRFRTDARLLTPAQRREILRRDGFCCSNPGCQNHLWLNIHHIVFYCEAGPTLPGNLVAVCGRCHRNVHHNRLVVTGTRDRLSWTNAQGVRLQELATTLPGLGFIDWNPDLSMHFEDWDW